MNKPPEPPLTSSVIDEAKTNLPFSHPTNETVAGLVKRVQNFCKEKNILFELPKGPKI